MTHASTHGPSSLQPGSQQLQLVVHAGPLAGKGFPITKNTLTFGRGPDNDIVLDDTQVSRNHARLTLKDTEIILEDLGSTNGTLVNGRPVAAEHVLQPADIISIGSSVFGVKGFAAPHTIGITQISMEPRTYPPPVAAPTLNTPSPQPKPAARAAESSGTNLLLIGGLLALVVVVLLIAAATAYFLTQDRGSSVSEIPAVVITAPLPNSQIEVNLPVTVQATASSPAGVKKMELWVSNIKTAEAISPVEQGQSTLTASFQWTPPAAGSYTLEVKAFTAQNAVSAPTTVIVNAVGGPATTQETPTPTPTPATPTPTVPSNPALTTKTDLNVRSGPGIQYDLLGLLPAGVTVEIIGREETRQWWQVRFSPAADGVGWVAADPAFSTTANVDNVPIAQIPPTPTGTPTPTIAPTDTAIPATSTSTATPIIPTNTPLPTDTPTATSQPTIIDFNISPTQIQGGECVNITWNVVGVREVYFEDQGVGGSANFNECPKETNVYNFRVVRLDGSEYREDIPVEVINPIVSEGETRLEADKKIDLDRGKITDDGDDFAWEVDGDSRILQTKSGAQFVIMGDQGELEKLTFEECNNVSMGPFSSLDGSEGASGDNVLLEDISICYRTSENRLGKMRFPDGSEEDLKIEWLTWK
jgi:uncharacterized protein YraI